MENTLVPLGEVQKIIAKDFQVEEVLPAPSNFNELKTKLVSIISFLLDQDMNRLLAIFYRIDLNEHQVNAILSRTPVEKIPIQLAELVLEREMEKVKTRLNYKKG